MPCYQSFLGYSGQFGAQPSMNGACSVLHFRAHPSIHGACSVFSLFLLGPLFEGLQGVSFPLFFLPSLSLTFLLVTSFTIGTGTSLLAGLQVILVGFFFCLGGDWGNVSESLGDLGVDYFSRGGARSEHQGGQVAMRGITAADAGFQNLYHSKSQFGLTFYTKHFFH